MKSLALLLLVSLPVGCKAPPAGDLRWPLTRGDVARAQFERIRSLAGAWKGTFGSGATAGPGETRFRLTAGGSAVEEVLFPGTPHEMVTFYHLDGERLVLTHYCSAGNQPRMVARSGARDLGAKTIRFEFAGATNLASPDAGHMHEAELTIEDDRLRTRWTFYERGEPAEVARFDLARAGTP